MLPGKTPRIPQQQPRRDGDSERQQQQQSGSREFQPCGGEGREQRGPQRQLGEQHPAQGPGER